MTRFNEVKEKHLSKLVMYVPVVERVHGGHHPEFYEVRKVFNQIQAKLEAKETETPDLSQEFARLREITGGYTVPGDVCETYEAVYNMLAELDRAYHE